MVYFFLMQFLKRIYKDLHWVRSVAGNLNSRFNFSEFLSPLVSLENTLAVRVACESICSSRRSSGWKSLYRGVSYVVHIRHYCEECSRSSY